MDYTLVKSILSTLDQHHNATLYDLILQTLRSADHTIEWHQTSLLTQLPDLLDVLSEKSAGRLESSTIHVARATYQAEVQRLIQPSTGFHFKGSSASLAQLESFSIAQMGRTIQKDALNLWALLGVLLDANLSRRRAVRHHLSTATLKSHSHDTSERQCDELAHLVTSLALAIVNSCMGSYFSIVPVLTTLHQTRPAGM